MDCKTDPGLRQPTTSAGARSAVLGGFMQEFFAIIGGVVVCFAICGACIPGCNFHVFFGGDEGAVRWHKASAAEISEELEAKAQK